MIGLDLRSSKTAVIWLQVTTLSLFLFLNIFEINAEELTET